MRLQLTKRADYAIRACILLATSDGRPVSSRRIAELTDVPAGFIPRVLGDLQRAGVVEASVGKAGGYRLRRDPRELSLHELIEALEGPTIGNRCVLEDHACGGGGEPCAFHGAWSSAQVAFVRVLASTTLAEIAEKGRPGSQRTDGIQPTALGLERPERISA